MSQNPISYRRGWFVRLINYQIWGICLLLAFGSTIFGIGILIISREYPVYLLALIFFLLPVYILFYSRVSYYVAHGNKLILYPDGIEYCYLGIHGFAKWSDMLYFDEDQERAWLNTTYQTSDFRVTRISFLVFTWYVPLRNKSVIGIRLKHAPKLSKGLLSTLPKTKLDFIPLSLLVDIPRLKDGTGDINKFIKTKFAQDLLQFAPHLFE